MTEDQFRKDVVKALNNISYILMLIFWAICFLAGCAWTPEPYLQEHEFGRPGERHRIQQSETPKDSLDRMRNDLKEKTHVRED